MTRIKKFIVPVLCAVIILFSAITIMGFVTEKTAYAETRKQFTVEDYTNSDFVFDGEAMTYSLPNGRKFKLSAEEDRKIFT